MCWYQTKMDCCGLSTPSKTTLSFRKEIVLVAEHGMGHVVFHFARWPEIKIDIKSQAVATEGNKMRGLGTKGWGQRNKDRPAGIGPDY